MNGSLLQDWEGSKNMGRMKMILRLRSDMRVKMKIYSRLALFFACILLSASVFSAIGDVEVLMAGERLKQDIDVSNKVIRSVGQLKKAGVTLQNVSRNLYQLEYMAHWFDDFSQIVSTSTWQRFTLHPNAGIAITSVGKTPDSTRVVFQVRLPDDATIQGGNFGQESFSQ